MMGCGNHPFQSIIPSITLDYAMSWEADDISLVPVEWLKPHEEIKVKNRDKY